MFNMLIPAKAGGDAAKIALFLCFGNYFWAPEFSSC